MGNHRIQTVLLDFPPVSLGMAHQPVHHTRSPRCMAATKIQSQYLAESVWLKVITQLFILQYGAEPWYRHVCAIGAVLNILDDGGEPHRICDWRGWDPFLFIADFWDIKRCEILGTMTLKERSHNL